MRSRAIEAGADPGAFRGPRVGRNPSHEPTVEMDVGIAARHLDELDPRPDPVRPEIGPILKPAVKVQIL